MTDKIIAFQKELGYDDKKAKEFLRYSLLEVLGTNIDDYLVEPNTILKESFRANVSAIVQAHTLVKKD